MVCGLLLWSSILVVLAGAVLSKGFFVETRWLRYTVPHMYSARFFVSSVTPMTWVCRTSFGHIQLWICDRRPQRNPRPRSCLECVVLFFGMLVRNLRYVLGISCNISEAWGGVQSVWLRAVRFVPWRRQGLLCYFRRARIDPCILFGIVPSCWHWVGYWLVWGRSWRFWVAVCFLYFSQWVVIFPVFLHSWLVVNCLCRRWPSLLLCIRDILIRA